MIKGDGTGPNAKIGKPLKSSKSTQKKASKKTTLRSHKKWTDTEIAKLNKLFKEGKSYIYIAKSLKRSYYSVVNKVYSLQFNKKYKVKISKKGNIKFEVFRSKK